MRAFTCASSAGAMCMPALLSSGSDGCDSTGARTAGSSISDSAKLPVKHMPIAPTPRPPQSGCAWAASARSQSITGLDLSAAKARNSRLMQARAITPRPRSSTPADAGIAEEPRHEDGEAGVAHPAREARDVRRDAGHLGHHDHGRALARDEHELALAEEGQLLALEVLERVALAQVAGGGVGHAVLGSG